MKLFASFSTSRARRASRFFALFVALGCFVGCQSTGPKSLTSDDCPGCDAESQDVQRAQTPEAPAAPSSLNSTSTGSSSAPTNTGAQIDFFDSGNVAGNYDEPAYYGGGSSNGAALRSSYSSDAYISEANKTTTASVSAAAVDPSSRLESNSLPEAPQTSSLQSASQSFQNSATKLQEKTQEALTSAQNGLQNAVDAAGNAANELQTKAQDALNSARDGLQNAADSIQNSANELQNKAQNSLNSARDGLQNAADSIQNSATELQNKTQNALDAAQGKTQNATPQAGAPLGQAAPNLNAARSVAMFKSTVRPQVKESTFVESTSAKTSQPAPAKPRQNATTNRAAKPTRPAAPGYIDASSCAEPIVDFISNGAVDSWMLK